MSLALANAFMRNGASKMVAFLIALPIFLMFVIIAFFKFSELRIHEFIAKMMFSYRQKILSWIKKNLKDCEGLTASNKS